MDRREQLKGCFFIVLSAVIFGCMPLGASVLYAEGVTPTSLVFLRNILALPALALLARRQGGLSISRGALCEVSFAGFIGCCLTPVLLFTSYRYLASGMATIFHFSYPVVVMLGGILLHEKVGKRAAFCTLLCTCGILLLFEGGGSVSLPGAAFALASGITYAIYILLLAHFRHREITGFRLSFYVSTVCSLCTLLFCLATDQFALPQSLTGWCVSILFSLALSVGAVVLFQQGTFLVGGQRAAILSTFEPITSIFAGVLFLNEILTPRALAGSALTLLAGTLAALSDGKGKNEPSASDP